MLEETYRACKAEPVLLQVDVSSRLDALSKPDAAHKTLQHMVFSGTQLARATLCALQDVLPASTKEHKVVSHWKYTLYLGLLH